jgi:hypothetical protein
VREISIRHHPLQPLLAQLGVGAGLVHPSLPPSRTARSAAATPRVTMLSQRARDMHAGGPWSQ